MSIAKGQNKLSFPGLAVSGKESPLVKGTTKLG